MWRGVRAALSALLLIAGLGATGCGKKTAANVEDIGKELESAGLKAEGFAAADGSRYAAYRCQTGRVEGLDALACEYGDAATALANKAKVESWIGNAVTGVALVRDKMVLAVSDRTRQDLNGKSINKVAKAFLGKK